MIKERKIPISIKVLKIHYFFVFVLILSCAPQKEKLPVKTTDFCSNIHRNDSISLSKQLEDLADSIQTKTGVYVLEDGAGAMDAESVAPVFSGVQIAYVCAACGCRVLAGSSDGNHLACCVVRLITWSILSMGPVLKARFWCEYTAIYLMIGEMECKISSHRRSAQAI